MTNTKLLTREEMNKKYKWKYVMFYRVFDYDKKVDMFEIRKTSKTIKKGMTLWEDVGTSYEYTR